MKYLLDTHILLWALLGDKRLSSIKKDLKSPRNEIYFSSASIWEITIKNMKGKINVGGRDIFDKSIDMEYIELPIKSNHIALLTSLSRPESGFHTDPFDNILIAQAKAEGMILITKDSAILKYGESCIKGIK